MLVLFAQRVLAKAAAEVVEVAAAGSSAAAGGSNAAPAAADSAATGFDAALGKGGSDDTPDSDDALSSGGAADATVGSAGVRSASSVPPHSEFTEKNVQHKDATDGIEQQPQSSNVCCFTAVHFLSVGISQLLRLYRDENLDAEALAATLSVRLLKVKAKAASYAALRRRSANDLVKLADKYANHKAAGSLASAPAAAAAGSRKRGPLSDRCPTTCRTPPLSLSLQLLLHGVTHHLAVLLVEGVGATHAGVLLEV